MDVIQMVWNEVRGKLWSRAVWWLLLSIVTAVLTAAAYAAGAFAGWGGMDIGETCGDFYDDAFRAKHLDDPLFPLHNWCNADQDLVPSWVNPTVAGLAVLCAVCLVMTMVLGVARVIRKKKQRELKV
ncbi:hypothetical protein ACIQU4_39340 [Streptomyces sp. NPDC090741]|uniref:hypothetical protein n=1 Tax=Streptomyces sp. NPDC090741 TaxID=3365967 RepID=UPI00381016D4